MISTIALRAEIEKYRDSDDAIKVLMDPKVSDESVQAMRRLLQLFDACIEEVVYSEISDDSKSRHCRRLDRFFAQLLHFLRTPHHARKDFDFDRLLEYLELLADNVSRASEAAVQDRAPLNSIGIRDLTTGLIDEVAKSDLAELSKRAITLKLQGIRKMCELPAIFTEREVRMHVKMVMADVFSEWDYFRKQDEAVAVKLKEWASNVLQGSRRLLGLTADAATVAGLISPPK
jgi:hypothetical protein